MNKNGPYLIAANQIRKVIASYLDATAAGSKPQTKEEFIRQAINRLKKNFIELIRDFGEKGPYANQLWANIEKNLDIQLDKWYAQRFRDTVM